MLAVGVVEGIVVLWREEKVVCKEVMTRVTSISCLFENRLGGEEWLFTGVYCRDSREEKTLVWRELEDCKNRWSGK